MSGGPNARGRDRQQDEYANQVGPDALSRQRQAAKDRWGCCGEWRSGPHHTACPNYEEPDAPPVHADQATLL